MLNEIHFKTAHTDTGGNVYQCVILFFFRISIPFSSVKVENSLYCRRADFSRPLRIVVFSLWRFQREISLCKNWSIEDLLFNPSNVLSAYRQAFALLVLKKYTISMLKSRMPMKVALVAMVLLIIGAHFVAAGEKILLYVHDENPLQFLAWEHN